MTDDGLALMARRFHQRPIRPFLGAISMAITVRAAANAHRQRDAGAHSAPPNRSRQIAKILVRNGFGFIIGRVGREARIPWPSPPDGAHADTRSVSSPERVRLTIEELGPTFIKLGQILSTRGDLVPANYRAELIKLQDAAPPVPEDQVRAELLAELGRPIEDVFTSFDFTPLASASIGQAHAATLPDGTEVVVKLRRPGALALVTEDLRILQDLALRASQRWEAARDYDLVGIAQEFAQVLRTEFDYVHEAHNVERIAENFAADETAHIPKVYWDLTTARMLTLERIYGCKITDFACIAAEGLSRNAIARRAAYLLLTMILDHGFFHADPHPGNVLVEQDGRIGLLDFGMVGAVDAATQGRLLRLVMGVTEKNAGALADVVLELGIASARVDRNALRRDMQRLLDRYGDSVIGDVPVGAFLSEVMDAVRRQHIRLPSDLALLFKTLAMGEGLAKELDPSFNLLEVYIPITHELVRRQVTPAAWTKQLLLAGIDALQVTMQVPQQLRRILGDIERGGFEVNLQPASFDPYFARLERLVNRVLIALLAATCTISTAMIVAASHPARLDWVAEALFLMALVFAGVFGVYILVALLRSRNSRGH
jgi:ubiquinone biosynthesis protein